MNNEEYTEEYLEEWDKLAEEYITGYYTNIDKGIKTIIKCGMFVYWISFLTM